jgi:hypothetical protein
VLLLRLPLVIISHHGIRYGNVSGSFVCNCINHGTSDRHF